MIKGRIILMATLLVSCLALVSGGRVKVFLLAGQSNMVGRAHLEHLRILIHASDKNEYRDALWNHTGFKIRDDVFFTFEHFAGNLTVDSSQTFGPEVGFGWTMGEAFEEPVLLVKTAWGGSDLAADFRPPSSGTGSYDNIKPHQYGTLYRLMINSIYLTLDRIAEIVPQYNEEDGYELMGFVWFQGWADLLDWNMIREYKQNLIHFIQDVRLDLETPDLPLIVGELGVRGLHPDGNYAPQILKMRAIQEETTKLEEFRESTLFVRTAPYVVLNDSIWAEDYHYFGRADTMYHIGQAFGKGMLQLLAKSVDREHVKPVETTLT